MAHAGLVATYGRLDAIADEVEPFEWWFDNARCEIGREPGVHLVVSRREVSRHHARIERAGVAHFLSDLDSRNGTYLNGSRLCGAVILADCDDIGFGAPEPAVRFREFEADEVPQVRPKHDEATNRFLLGRQPLGLTPEENALLLVLWTHFEKVCDRSACATGIWGPNHPPSLERTALDKIVDGLRDKVRRVNPTGDPIMLVGDGYRLAG